MSFRLWSFRHVAKVDRLVGFKRDSGGAIGVGHLRRTLDTLLFPEPGKVRTDH